MIVDKIVEKVVGFETKTGQQPESIYLGMLEWIALVRYVQDATGFGSCQDPQIMGKRVFVVSESSHLAVS